MGRLLCVYIQSCKPISKESLGQSGVLQPQHYRHLGLDAFLLGAGGVLCIVFSSIPGSYSLDASRTPPRVMTTKTASRHCQMSPGQGEGGENQCQLINA